MKSIPASAATSMMRSDSSRSVCRPNVIVPRQSSLTFRPVRPIRTLRITGVSRPLGGYTLRPSERRSRETNRLRSLGCLRTERDRIGRMQRRFGESAAPDRSWSHGAPDAETVSGQALYQSTITQSEAYLDAQSALGTIDTSSNLRGQPVYLWSGTHDSVVNPKEMVDLNTEYQHYGAVTTFDNAFAA